MSWPLQFIQGITHPCLSCSIILFHVSMGFHNRLWAERFHLKAAAGCSCPAFSTHAPTMSIVFFVDSCPLSYLHICYPLFPLNWRPSSLDHVSREGGNSVYVINSTDDGFPLIIHFRNITSVYIYNDWSHLLMFFWLVNILLVCYV